jgi:putative transposase
MYDWRTGRTCVHENKVNLAFVTKYSKEVFTREMVVRLNGVFSETCAQMQCALLESTFNINYVHLIVQVHPKSAISNLVGKLKGKSSYILRKEYGPLLKGKLWGNKLWAPGYCVVSNDAHSANKITAYINDQNTPPSNKAIRQSSTLRNT